MLLNLLGNAIEFTPPGVHITISATIKRGSAARQAAGGRKLPVAAQANGAGSSPAPWPLEGLSPEKGRSEREIETGDVAAAHVPGFFPGHRAVRRPNRVEPCIRATDE